MQKLAIKRIEISQLSKEKTVKQVFCQQPIIIVADDSVIKANKIENNIVKQIETSNIKSLFVVDLLADEQKTHCEQSQKNIKISFELLLKNVFEVERVREGKFDDIFIGLKVQKLIKSQQQVQDNLIELEEASRKYKQQERRSGSWSMRLYPFHKSVNRFAHYLPQCIVPMFSKDILSYQKVQRFSNYQYVFALSGYEESINGMFQTQVYLNWGNVPVQYEIVNGQQDSNYSGIVNPNEMIVIPPMSRHKLKTANSEHKQVAKLLTWKLLPKSNFSTIIKNLQPQTRKPTIPYPIYQILIDYCFHEFALIEIQSEQLMYTLANLLNRQFLNQLYELQNVLKLQQKDIENGGNDKKCDECHCCGQFIVNYFGYYKNMTYCLKCVQNDIKVDKVYQKLPKSTFQEGCQLLTQITSYKQEKQDMKQCVWKLMQNAVFFQYEDICDGDFIGSYHSTHCKNNQASNKKPRNSKQKIVQNSINLLKKQLQISTPKDIIKKYSIQTYENEEKKKIYRKILTRASYFMTKKEQTDLLVEMLPNYQENNLKLFAIKLCVKDGH